MRVCATLLLLAAAHPVGAMAQGGSDVYVVEVGPDGRFGVPVNVTRRPGYDNQPSFTPDGAAFLYTSIRADGQADTYRYDLAARRISRITRTPESEYSPTVMPGGMTFSAVRVEMDSTQRLWRFRLDGTDPTIVLQAVKPVGYHAWADDHTVALFVLGNPSTLQIANLGSGDVQVVAHNIGRSLHPVPGRHAVSFLHRADDETWIKVFDLDTQRTESLVVPLERNEFYAWTPDGALVMGAGSRLYRWREGDADWTQVADLSGSGVTGISRIAVSPDGSRWAVVAEDAPGS